MTALTTPQTRMKRQESGHPERKLGSVGRPVDKTNRATRRPDVGFRPRKRHAAATRGPPRVDHGGAVFDDPERAALGSYQNVVPFLSWAQAWSRSGTDHPAVRGPVRRSADRSSGPGPVGQVPHRRISATPDFLVQEMKFVILVPKLTLLPHPEIAWSANRWTFRGRGQLATAGLVGGPLD